MWRQGSRRCHGSARPPLILSSLADPGHSALRAFPMETIMSANVYGDPAPRGPGVVETTTTMVATDSHIHRRISWAAIFGGVIMIIVVQLLLSMLGAGIGLGTVNVNAGSTPDVSSFEIGPGSGG